MAAPPQQIRADPPSTISDSAKTRVIASGSASQGDTQPASPWTHAKLLGRDHASGQDSPAGGLAEGESGHVNIIAAVQRDVDAVEGADANSQAERWSGSPGFADEVVDDYADQISQEMRAERQAESHPFLAPKTPMTQGMKRKRDGSATAPRTETPRLPVNLFANLMSPSGGMGASQLFEATQAVTSPNILLPDHTRDRPSPNLNQQRPSTADSVSSPARRPRVGFQRALTEPQETYVSMKESQEKREEQRRLQEERERALDDSSDEDFPTTSIRLRSSSAYAHTGRGGNRFLHRQGHNHDKITRLAGENLAAITSSPRRSGQTAEEALTISDDVPALDDNANTTEEETEREDEAYEKEIDDDADELAEDNKENVQIPMTVSRMQHRNSQVVRSQPSPSQQQGGKGQSGLRRVSTHKILALEETANPRNSQTFAIYDSQSSQILEIDKQVPASSSPIVRLGPPHSSLDSRNIVVPQSQFSPASRSPILTAQTARSSKRDIVDGNASQRSLPGRRLQYESSSSEDELSSQADIRAAHRRSDNRLSGIVSKVGSQSGLCDKEVGSPKPVNNEKAASHTGSILAQESCCLSNNKSSEPLKASTRSDPQFFHSPHSKTKSNAPNEECSTSASLHFATAPENNTTSPSKVIFSKTPSRLSSTVSSPANHQRRRTFGEITGDPSPPDQEVDLNFSLMNADDIEFQKTVYGSQQSDRVPFLEATARNKSFKPTYEPGCSPDRPPSIEHSPLSSFDSQINHPNTASSQRSHVTKMNESGQQGPAEAQAEDSSPTYDEIVNNITPAEVEATLQGSQPITAETVLPAPEPDIQIEPDHPVALDDEVEVTNTAEPAQFADVHRHDFTESLEKEVVAPNRVLALFHGANLAFYSGTCVGLIPGEEPRYQVRFDDGTNDTVGMQYIKRLELRAGDAVRVDRDGERAKNFIVVGMTDRLPTEPARQSHQAAEEESACTEVDIHGFRKAILVQKPPGTYDGVPEGARIEVPLYQIYIISTKFSALTDRSYNFVSSHALPLDGLSTPAQGISVPSSPQSRGRRNKNPNQISASALMSPALGGLFTDMAFTLTNIEAAADLAKTKSLILGNGGRVLEDGFAPLFYIPDLTSTITGPAADLSDTGDADFQQQQQNTLHLTAPASTKISFTALIADTHCRRAKYIQALALGIPCLATRWVSDSIAKSALQPWPAYLLPAGESSFLGNGAVRSRVFPSTYDYSPHTARLAGMLQARPTPFNGMSVLLLVRREEEKQMELFPLLVLAMGPAKVLRVGTLDALVREVRAARDRKGDWDWVVVFGGEGDVERMLFGSASGGGKGVSVVAGKKRKSGGGGGGHSAPVTTGVSESGIAGTGAVDGKRKPKVVGKEFLIQSLILGRLVDE